MSPVRKFIIGAVALGSLAGGAVGLSSLGTANAASPAVVATADTAVPVPVADGPSSAADSSATPPANAPSGPHTANGITESVLTGDTASSVEAAVKAAYPDATIERMETDAEGATYEAHITKADGGDATVKLDAAFAITDTVSGHG